MRLLSSSYGPALGDDAAVPAAGCGLCSLSGCLHTDDGTSAKSAIMQGL